MSKRNFPLNPRSLFALAILLTGVIGSLVFADEQADDLARLQGTWKVVEYERQGVRSVSKVEKTWTFDRKVLSTRLGKLPPIVFDIEVKANSNPKELMMTMRGTGGRSLPERSVYRFVGETLEVVSDQNLNVLPKSFETKGNSKSTIQVLKKTGKGEALPQEEVISHSKNAEAEAALLKFQTAVLKHESLESIEPYVAGGKAKELWDLLPNVGAPHEAIEAEMKLTGVRDIQAGERLYYANGTEKIVAAEGLTDNKMLLMLVQGERELGFYLMIREQKSWKVDVTNLIGLLRAPGRPLYRGIREGMELDRAKKLLDDYKSSGAFQSFKLESESKTELTASLVEGDLQIQLRFEAPAGKLTNVITRSSRKAK